MPRQLTLADIICNGLDKDYSVEQAAIDFGELMIERELIKRRYGTEAKAVFLVESDIRVTLTGRCGFLAATPGLQKFRPAHFSQSIQPRGKRG
jgi:hypothetical protein